MEILIVSIMLALASFMLGLTVGFSGSNSKLKTDHKEDASYKAELLSADINNKYNVEIEISKPRSYDLGLDKKSPIIIYDQKCQIKKIT